MRRPASSRRVKPLKATSPYAAGGRLGGEARRLAQKKSGHEGRRRTGHLGPGRTWHGLRTWRNSAPTSVVLIRRVAVPNLGNYDAILSSAAACRGTSQGPPHSPAYQSRPGQVRTLPVTVNFQFLKDNIPRVQPQPRRPEPFQRIHVVLVVPLPEARQMAQHLISLLDGAHVHGNLPSAACEISRGLAKQQSCHARQRASGQKSPGRRALTRKDCLPLITPSPISWIQARTGLLGPSPAMAWESDCDPCRMHVQVRNLLGVWLRKIGEPASDSPSNLENPTGNNPLAVDIQPRTPEHGPGGITRQELALAA